MSETLFPESEALAVYNFLKIKDQPKPADVIFVLGGSSIKPPTKAAELYWEGFSPVVAFISQGGNFGGESIWGMSEVDKYKAVLLERELPESALVYAQPEEQTRNTLAEAQAAIPFLRQRGIDPKTMILVSRPMHQRRAYATFRRQHPNIDYINAPADEPLNISDPVELVRLVQELQRLLDYGVKKDDIERPSIEIKTLRSAAELKRYLKDHHHFIA